MQVQFGCCLIEGREKKEESGESFVNVYLSCGSPACCCQPAVAGGFIYADLRSGLTLTWPRRLCLLRVLLGATAIATSFPLSKHTGRGDTAPAFSGQHVYLQFTWEVALPPSPVEFSSHHHFYELSRSWLLGMCHHSCLLWPACLFTAGLFIYSSHGKWAFPPLLWSFSPTGTFMSFPTLVCWVAPPLLPSLASLFIYSSMRGCPSSPLQCSGAPCPLCYMSFLLLLLIIQFFFFSPWVGVRLSRGLC
jgi:hypothetical protein